MANRTAGLSLKICPHCQRAFPPAVDIGGTRRQQIYDFISRHPEGVTAWQVLEGVYADDPNGGPVGHNIVSVQVKNINVALEQRGYAPRIKSTSRGGAGARYFVDTSQAKR